MRQLKIKVHPRAKKNRLQQQSESFWEVWLTAPAQDNQANLALIRFLAKSFHLSRSRILILNGEKSQIKMIGISETKESYENS